MAVDAGASAIEVFYCEGLFTGTEAALLLSRFRQTAAELVPVSEQVLRVLSQRDEPQGIVATFALLDVPLRAIPLDGDELVLVVDRLQDPGNLGTLIRTADAVGATAVVMIEPCVDAFDPKTVRGSMGSLFTVPLVHTEDVSQALGWLREQGLQIVGADAQLGTAWGTGLWAGGTVLVLGNEARGLSEDVRAHIEAWAALPIIGQAESLNVAVAGGTLMYAWLKANWRN